MPTEAGFRTGNPSPIAMASMANSSVYTRNPFSTAKRPHGPALVRRGFGYVGTLLCKNHVTAKTARAGGDRGGEYVQEQLCVRLERAAGLSRKCGAIIWTHRTLCKTT